MNSNLILNKKLLTFLLLLGIQLSFITCQNKESSTILTEEKYLQKLKSTVHESEGIKILNDMIYNNVFFSNYEPLKLMSERRWMRACKLIVDFMSDHSKQETKTEVEKIVETSKNYIGMIKRLLKDKKKNIVKISPVFEWSQDNELIKIRLKFAKNLESPGEKEIQDFRVLCKRQRLIVHGWKNHGDYVAHYYRDVHLYDMIKTYSCTSYKETEGTYIIKFQKNQPTLYWNHLDLFTESHENMYTWFDVFTQYDDKAKYTEFREFTQQNLLEKDINEYVQEKSEEKKLRLEKIKRIMEYLRTKDFENKNYCNSPVNEKFCYLLDVYDWNYWLS
jgi:hypothetical protein